MSEKPETKNVAGGSDGWLKTLYQEAWKQYCHEDNLGLARTSLFLTIHAALLGLVSAVAKPLIETAPRYFVSGRALYIGYAVFGVLMLVIGLFLIFLTFPWKSATIAGNRYLNLRWTSIAVIETLAGVHQSSIALLEDKWRGFSRANPGTSFVPYPEDARLGWLCLRPHPRTGGWASVVSIITAIRVLDGLIVVVGLVLLVLTYWLWNCSGAAALAASFRLLP